MKNILVKDNFLTDIDKDEIEKLLTSNYFPWFITEERNRTSPLEDISNLNNEILRILKPNGLNIFTVRNEYDGDFQKGISRGEDMYENDGFIVHFFTKEKIQSLMNGFNNEILEMFEEGAFPRRLYFVVNKKTI